MNVNQAKGIVQGFTNLLKSRTGLANEEVEELAAARLAICKKCPLFRVRKSGTYICDPQKRTRNEELDRMVNGCGCHLQAKTRQEYERCPASKW